MQHAELWVVMETGRLEKNAMFVERVFRPELFAAPVTRVRLLVAISRMKKRGEINGCKRFS